MTIQRAFLTTCLLALHICCLAQQKLESQTGDKKTIKLFFEKTYLQTDRSFYSSGEDIWFSAYLVNGKSTSLTSTSNNLYVELISAKAEMVDKKVIRLDNGLGKGDFKLGDSIPAGWYVIRAYTNWMRNFGNEFVFQKKIYITNTLNEKASYYTRDAKKAQPVAATSKKTISFYPEGGSLVEGINSIVAFKTSDDLGEGIKVTGSIVASKGDTITTFQSTDAGVGIFAFAPKAGEKYHVAGFYGKEKFSADLPQALQKGLVMHVTTDSLTIRASISANDLLFAGLHDKSISIVIKHAGESVYSGTIPLTKPNVSVSIPTKDIPQGLSVITLLDDLGRPNCERLVYIQGNSQVNFTVTTNKPTYGLREKVSVRIKATDILGQPVKTSLSLAAVDGIVPQDGSNILSYLLLESEVKGEIRNAEQYFDPQNPSRFKQLDLLLLTQGWRDYLWRSLAETPIKISFMPEPGISLTGRVREKIANKPIPDMNITLFGSSFTGSKIFMTRTNQDGQYFLDGLNWVGNQEMKISSKDDKGKNGGWLLLDSVFKAPMPISLRYKLATDKIPSDQLNVEIAKRMAYNRSTKFAELINLNDVEIKADKNKKVEMFDQTLTTFGYPDQLFTITAADYSYKGLEHYLLTKVNGAVPIDDLDSVSTEGVAFIAAGKKIRPRIVVNNREDLFERLDYYSLSMDQVNQIKVRHLIGNSGQDVFVILLDLKESAFHGNSLNLINTNLDGYYLARTFYSPEYYGAPTKNKDLRTTIFWAPAIKTNEKGEANLSFFNGDNKSDVVLKVNGITEHGLAVSSKSTYKVQ